MRQSYLQLAGSAMPECHSYGHNHPWPQGYFPAVGYSHHLQRKEIYPSYIKMSNERFRGDRTKNIHKLIGKNFRTLRGFRELSIEQIAQDIHLPIETIHQLEAGTLIVTPSMLVLLCNYFQVIIDCMIYQDLSLEQ